MSGYAIRRDGAGWRAVNGLEDVLPDEDFSETRPAPPMETLEQLKNRLIVSIDDHIAGIYARFQRFQMEYIQREAVALAYKNAGYTGPYSPWIDVFANNAGLSLQAATDLILQQAIQLRGALEQLGALRMMKYGINSAEDEAAANTLHDQIVSDADVIAAAL